MEINKMIYNAQRPEIYTRGTAEMWTDDYISTQLLAIHLDPEIELASRKEPTIYSTIEWILKKAPGEGLNILDLGCGPGLYTEKFAEKKHIVTGMDFSPCAIHYAKNSAAQKNLKISYRQKNYLELNDKNKYDLILMIFTDFGVLPPEQRKRLLANIHRALKPGGKFIFDVLNENYPTNPLPPREWELSAKGFWRERPYLALTESFYYENQKVLLNQHMIIDEKEKMDIYRFWMHFFSHNDLEEIVSLQGFTSTECHENVIPGCEMYSSDAVTFCITTR